MPKLLVLILILAVARTFSHAAEENADPLKTDKDRMSYSAGLDMGRSLKERGLQLSTEAFLLGAKDGLNGTKPRLTDEQIQAALESFEKEMIARQNAAASESAERNKKEGEDYLKANKEKEGVRVLPSGLQYKVVKMGEGPKPAATDMVKVHYRGTLTDGTEFDSSYRRNEPTMFPVNRVIAGWSEALQLMPVGSKWQLTLPSSLAYGEEGAGGRIGPHAVLLFDVELLSIEKSDSK